MEADIIVYETVDSTNIQVAKLADAGAREGTCVVAFCQTQGQGRSGRSFYSPKGGNLYMSLLLRPRTQEAAGHITVAAAVATVNAIENKFGIKCGIKWVNDIILNKKKVCGMVAQAYNVGRDDFYVVLGIGVNIYDSPDIPEDIVGIYGSLFGKPCDIGTKEAGSAAVDLASEIIKEFSVYYNDFTGSGCAGKYRALSVVTGHSVIYRSGNDEICAKVVDIDDEGGIVLKTPEGVRCYRDGEIRIRPCDM